MSEDVFPFHLRMGFSPDDFNRLLLLCEEHKVADITIQSGDFIWARHNRTYMQVSDRQLQDSEVSAIIYWLYGATGEAELLAGNALDFRAVASVSRDVSKNFRANAVRARVGDVDGGIQITLRTIPEHPPTLTQLGIEADIVNNMFPRYGLVLVVGTTGSGKSTLLAAGNRHRLEERRHDPVKIITFEDPIEYTYSGLAGGHMPEPAQTGCDLGVLGQRLLGVRGLAQLLRQRAGARALHVELAAQLGADVERIGNQGLASIVRLLVEPVLRQRRHRHDEQHRSRQRQPPGGTHALSLGQGYGRGGALVAAHRCIVEGATSREHAGSRSARGCGFPQSPAGHNGLILAPFVVFIHRRPP